MESTYGLMTGVSGFLLLARTFKAIPKNMNLFGNIILY
jgi:hypothetical protein